MDSEIELCNCYLYSEHKGILLKHKKEPSEYRPDIVHQVRFNCVHVLLYRLSGCFGRIHTKHKYDQALLTLLDSPLNKAGLLQIYIHTNTVCNCLCQRDLTFQLTSHTRPCSALQNIVIEVNPHIRIPRTFARFCGLMGMDDSVLVSDVCFFNFLFAYLGFVVNIVCHLFCFHLPLCQFNYCTN